MAASRPASAAVTPEQIDAAIAKAKAFLLSAQKADGTWEPSNGTNMTGGNTGIAVYALLADGVSPSDPPVARALSYLEGIDANETYVVSIRLQIWAQLPQTPALKRLIDQDAKWLLTAGAPTAPKWPGMFGYDTPRIFINASTSQYGVLGLWAAAKTGYDVPRQFWSAVDSSWRAAQLHDGGWAYQTVEGEGHGTASMTAAGITALSVAREYLDSDPDQAPDKGAPRRNNNSKPTTPDAIDPATDDLHDPTASGLAWFGRNFKTVGNKPYTLFGLQRVVAATGYRDYEGADWYAYGADALVKSQSPNGSWQESGEVSGAALGLAFLVRGRTPVLISKLRYEQSNNQPTGWNRRPRDAERFTRWMSGRLERDQAWQIVTLDAPLAHLLDAPVLYLSGKEKLDLADDDVDRLREYVEAGGCIVGNADAGSKDFSTSFEHLGHRLFNRDFRALPADHLIFTHQVYRASTWKSAPAVRGLSNGIRELMLLVNERDLGQSWQAASPTAKLNVAQTEGLELGADIVLYATDRVPVAARGSGVSLRLNPNVGDDLQSIRLARLQIGTNWDPEPGGWRRLAAILHNQFHTDLDVKPIELKSSEALGGFQFAHLTGTTAFSFTPEQRAAIQDFITRGGTLIVDAAGGSAAFAKSAEAELATIFGPNGPTSLLATTDPVYAFSAAPITSVSYRAFAHEKVAGLVTRPRVRGFRRGKGAVFYSREDLSAGLVGEQVDGIIGCAPASATALMRNILLSSAPAVAKR